jgi:uncharacterized protein (TIGR00297 family)
MPPRKWKSGPGRCDMIVNPLHLVVSVAAVTLLGLLFRQVGVFDATGFASATMTGCLVLIFGGVSWFLLLVSFLVAASFVTKYKYATKNVMRVLEDKGGARTWKNVVANGLMAAVAAVGHGVTGLRGGFLSSTVFPSLFLGAVGTAAADTLATEIGLLSRSEPRLITHWRQRVTRGVSGGVSLLGALASLLGALIVGGASVAFDFGGFGVGTTLAAALVSGVLGCTLDSLLGATIQARYACVACGTSTEQKTHCGASAALIKGWPGVDNDVVNFLSTFFGAVMALLLISVKALSA